MIAVARDEAFCFYYEDNLKTLERAGADIVFFSPLHDDYVPKEADALLLVGGYPELYAKELSQNKTMLADIKDRAERKMPIVAECGGFMYLHRTMEDTAHHVYEMAGVVPGDCFYTGKLVRFGYIELTEKEAEEIAALAGYTENYRKVINYHEVMQLKDRLKKIPLLFHYIDRHSKEAYGTAIGYLTQEGLLEPVPYALVDSGWIGTIQQSIEHLLRQKQPDRKLEGYYFGLYEIPEGEERENYHSFYFTPWGEIKRKVHFSNSLFEAVFSAPEGMTLSYRTESGKDKIIYVPVTDSRENLNRERISRYICWLEEFLQEKKQSLPQADSGYVEELLSPFMGNPTQFEAEAYGSLLFSDD